MVTIAPRLTIKEFEQLPSSEHRWALINGELVEMGAASSRHGVCAMRLAVRLGALVIPAGLGEVLGAAAGFIVSEKPPTVRVPDVAVVFTARLAALGDRDRIARAAPDLAVEVVSPIDSWREVWAKAAMWLDAGVQLVWIVDPASETVTALTPDAPARHFALADQLDGGALLPEFRMPLAEIFAF